MSVLFTGNHTVSGDTDLIRFGPLRLWAERGLIHVEDGDGDYKAMSVRTILTRANAVSEMLGNSTQREVQSEDQFDGANRVRHLNMLNGVVSISNKAKAQGMPSDPTARRDLKNRLPKTVTVPKLCGRL